MIRSALAGLVGYASRYVPRPADQSWKRTNFEGKTVSLGGGVSVAGGAVLVSLVTSGRVGAAGVIAGTSGAVAGYLDDHRESVFESGKGLKGHLSQLREGHLTTGVLKIGIIGAGAGASAAVLGSKSIPDWVVRSVAIAGTANLINLLDLRPGRALKATLAGTVLVAPGNRALPLLAGVAGTAAGALEEDLAGEAMLGDLGANAIGAVLGVAAASHPSRLVRLGVATGAVGLILASEKVSFSRVIDENPVLSAVDRWGR